MKKIRRKGVFYSNVLVGSLNLGDTIKLVKSKYAPTTAHYVDHRCSNLWVSLFYPLWVSFTSLDPPTLESAANVLLFLLIALCYPALQSLFWGTAIVATMCCKFSREFANMWLPESSMFCSATSSTSEAFTEQQQLGLLSSAADCCSGWQKHIILEKENQNQVRAELC